MIAKKILKKSVKFFWKLTGIEKILYHLRKISDDQLFRGIIEDCSWLKYKSFAPGGYAMDNAALYTLFRILNEVKPKSILEFGLGQSSKMVHQYATFFGDVTALTIEHDNDWINFFRNSISEDIKINIKQLDKNAVKFNGFETLTYKDVDLLYAGGGHEYDLIIVDGPFGSKHYSRSQIIGFVEAGLPERFCIFMDDTGRRGEKETINKICEILKNKKIKYLKKEYTGEKYHTIICSNELKFLTSLRGIGSFVLYGT